MDLLKRKSFIDHLSEFRKSAIKIVIAFFIAAIISVNFADQFLAFVTRGAGRLIFISPQEAFMTNIQVALLLGVFLSLPYTLYQIWKFISEGLKENEKNTPISNAI